MVKLTAHGMSAVFENPSRSEYVKYDVDGCLVKDKTAADCAVEEVGVGIVIVEFKGRNVEHALKQVSATTNYFRLDRGYTGKIASLVVARESPLASATMARHRNEFARKHNGSPLKIASSARQFVVSDLLTHRG